MIAVENTFTNLTSASSFEPRCTKEAPLYEAALLVDLAGGGGSIPAPDMDWGVFRDMTAKHGVLALVYHSLLRSGTEIPASFAHAAMEYKAAGISLAAELHALLALFAQHTLDVLPLKGPALSLTLYGDAGMRSSHDLDLLVRREDFSRAEALLQRQKFLPVAPLDEYHRRFLRDGLIVELHLGLCDRRYLPMDAEGAWNRARAVTFCATPAYAMCREDLALFLGCHAAKHGFSRLIWILDFAQSLQGWNHDEYESLLKLARRLGLAPWLFLSCAVLRSVFPHLLPAALDARLSSFSLSRRAARTAARLFSDAPQSGIRHYRFLYLQIEPSLWKRFRYCLDYFTPTACDDQCARSHHLPASFAFALRPFRLARKYGICRTFHSFFPQG